MATYPFSRTLPIGMIVLFLSACATQPIAKEYRNAAEAENLTFSMVLENPDAYVGAIVLWGGTILETRNIKDGTELVVLDVPLDEWEHPEGIRRSRGRFIAKSTAFLEPTLYTQGRWITLAGEIKGKKALPLGETTYTYPVVAIRQLHLWHRGFYHYRAYPYGYWGWDPFWGWGPYQDWDYRWGHGYDRHWRGGESDEGFEHGHGEDFERSHSERGGGEKK